MNKADRKCYVVDNGYVLARAFELSSNHGRLLENMVFLELLKKGYDLKDTSFSIISHEMTGRLILYAEKG